MVPLVGVHAGDLVAGGAEPGDFTVLDDVDAGLVGAAGETPCHVVVFGDSGARLIRRAQHGIANVGGDVDDRAQLLDLVGFDPLGVDAVEFVGLYPSHAVTDVLQGVRQVEHAALAEQDRVVEVVLEPFP